MQEGPCNRSRPSCSLPATLRRNTLRVHSLNSFSSYDSLDPPLPSSVLSLAFFPVAPRFESERGLFLRKLALVSVRRTRLLPDAVRRRGRALMDTNDTSLVCIRLNALWCITIIASPRRASWLRELHGYSESRRFISNGRRDTGRVYDTSRLSNRYEKTQTTL